MKFITNFQSNCPEDQKNTYSKSIMISGLLEKSQIYIDISIIHKSVSLKYPPWLAKQPTIMFDLIKYSKAKTNPIIYHEELQSIKDKHQNHMEMYTDGSKVGDKVACAAVHNKDKLLKRLPDKASIYSAEASAIELALNIIENSEEKKHIIFTDNNSVPTALENRKTDNPLTTKILNRIDVITKNKEIVFCWVPSHVGIKWNHRADQEAKKVLELEPAKDKIPFTDLIATINKHQMNKWQESWNSYTSNKLHAIKEQIGEINDSSEMTRKEQVTLSRLRMGHLSITHSYLLRKEAAPIYIPCQKAYTICHILTNCLDLKQTRQKYYKETNLKEVFLQVKPSKILEYIRETGLYNKI